MPAADDFTDSAPPSATAEPGAQVRLSANPADGELVPVRVPPAALLRYQTRLTQGGHLITDRGEASLQWERSAGRYQARWQVVDAQGESRTQTSQGWVSPIGLVPERYADQPRSEQAAHFDPEQQRVRFSNNAPDAPLQPGAQDRLSVLLQLGTLIGAAPHLYPPGTQISLQTVGTRDAPMWTFTVIRDEPLRTLAGTSEQAIYLVREPQHEWDVRQEVWLGRSLDYLPLRVRTTLPNGEVRDQLLAEAVVAGRTAPGSPAD